jgi:peptidase M23-like protein
MKSATICVGLAVILSCFLSAQAISKPQQPDIAVAWTSLVAWPLASPQPVLCTDDKIHLVYELLVMNVSSSAMTLDRLEMLDAFKDDAGTSTKSADTIVAMLQGADLEATIQAFPTGSTRTVGPFQLTRIFLDVKFAKDATLPKALTHRFQVTFAPATGTPPLNSATIVSGRTDVTNAPAVVIGPPLEGPRWVDAVGCCSPPSAHRTATMPINGKFVAFERFAIDFAQLNPENKLYTGPRDKLSSYAYVGARVLAVADGTVVNLQDGRPEETPPNYPQGYDLLQLLGNFVIVDIGHSHFAFYAHFQPNTLKVHKGDKVRRGQVLALLGNSGNSDAPHLHFGIEDGPLPFVSNGVPFVFSSFTTTGAVTNSFDDIAAGAAAQIGPARAGPHHNELPLNDDVITFPKQ